MTQTTDWHRQITIGRRYTKHRQWWEWERSLFLFSLISFLLLCLFLPDHHLITIRRGEECKRQEKYSPKEGKNKSTSSRGKERAIISFIDHLHVTAFHLFSSLSSSLILASRLICVRTTRSQGEENEGRGWWGEKERLYEMMLHKIIKDTTHKHSSLCFVCRLVSRSDRSRSHHLLWRLTLVWGGGKKDCSQQVDSQVQLDTRDSLTG